MLHFQLCRKFVTARDVFRRKENNLQRTSAGINGRRFRRPRYSPLKCLPGFAPATPFAANIEFLDAKLRKILLFSCSSYDYDAVVCDEWVNASLTHFPPQDRDAS